MLYLEDYLEMIEHLPQELRDRFTEMREMDLSVQNNMDSLEKRSRTLFSQCKKGEIQGPPADSEFQNLRKDYYKVLEDADEKVSLASQMHELVERYLRRLDSDLFKFKCELEADNNGITEILEKRSLELDGNSSMTGAGNQKENRYFGAIAGNNHTQKDNRYRHKPEKRRDSTSGNSTEKRPTIANNLVPPTPTPTVRPTTPNLGHHSVIAASATPSVSYSLQHIGAGNAIAAAASQAIAATQQMQQGRRTASLKASYEAIHGGTSGTGTHELLIGRELAGATHNVIQAVEREGSSMHTQKKHKKKHLNSSISHTTAASSSSMSSTSQVSSSNASDVSTARLNDNGLAVEQTTEGEWTFDPNEPRYCICNQVSYGDMVACDNEACPFEWFHYPCVGITQSPKGKWYCPKCTASMRRRGGRKN